jgi:hypothetical protein
MKFYSLALALLGFRLCCGSCCFAQFSFTGSNSSTALHFNINSPGFRDTSARVVTSVTPPSSSLGTLPYTYPVRPQRFGKGTFDHPGLAATVTSRPRILAFKDRTIDSALAYWVEGRTLHYVNLLNEEKSLPEKRVDWNVTARMNHAAGQTF